MKPWQIAALSQEPTKGDDCTSNVAPEIDRAWAEFARKAQERWLGENPYEEEMT